MIDMATNNKSTMKTWKLKEKQEGEAWNMA